VNLLIDPYVSRWIGARPPAFLKPEDLADAGDILVGHGHFDHAIDIPAIVQVAPKARVFCAPRVARVLAARRVPAERIHTLSPGQVFEAGGARVTALATRHIRYDLPLVLATLRRTGMRRLLGFWPLVGWPAGGPLSYLIEAEGHTVLHISTCGPTAAELESLAARAVDLLLIPLQGHTHIDRLAAHVAVRIRPRSILVHHQDDFAPPISQRVDVAPFRRRMQSMLPNVPVLEIDVGETIHWNPVLNSEEAT